KSYQCNDDEFVVDNRCFKLFGINDSFSLDVCQEGYTLHVIQNLDELKWISVILSPIAWEVWIGNDEDSSSFLRASCNFSIEKIKLRLGKDGFPDLSLRGSPICEDPEVRLPHLCSRPAQAYEDAVRDMIQNTANLGVKVDQTKDRFGGLRAFSYHPIMVAVRGIGKFRSNPATLHELCSMLPNGYVSSIHDFYNEDVYKKFRAKNMPEGSYR
ncbi:unnamed protein product, partial [Cylicocyclus nassatus]